MAAPRGPSSHAAGRWPAPTPDREDLRLLRRERHVAVPGRALRAKGLQAAQAGWARWLDLEPAGHAPRPLPAAGYREGGGRRRDDLRPRGREGRRQPPGHRLRRDDKPRWLQEMARRVFRTPAWRRCRGFTRQSP